MSDVIANQMSLSVFAIIVAVVALYLALRVVETALKVLLWGVVLVAGYTVAAPWLGWPELADIVHMAGEFEFAHTLQEWLALLRDAAGS